MFELTNPYKKLGSCNVRAVPELGTDVVMVSILTLVIPVFPRVSWISTVSF